MITWIPVRHGVKLILSCWAYNGEITHSWFLFRKKFKKKKLTTHTCMSCLHQLTPGCPSSMKMIKRYLNLNSKIKKKNKKKLSHQLYSFRKKRATIHLNPWSVHFSSSRELDCNYFLIKILSWDGNWNNKVNGSRRVRKVNRLVVMNICNFNYL